MQYFKAPIKVINAEEYLGIQDLDSTDSLKTSLIEAALTTQDIYFVAGLGIFIPSTVDNKTITYIGFGLNEDSITDISMSVEEFEKALQG